LLLKQQSPSANPTIFLNLPKIFGCFFLRKISFDKNIFIIFDADILRTKIEFINEEFTFSIQTYENHNGRRPQAVKRREL
jgi:hypothetical protein